MEDFAWDAGGESDSAGERQAEPWPRLWAKLVDLIIWGFPLGFLAGLLFPEFVMQPAFEGPGGEALFGAMLIPFALIVDAVVLSVFGNTPGKGLAGIQVETLDHEKPTLGTALKRNAQLYFAGLAMGIPIIALFTYSRNYNKLNNGEQTSWDVANDTRVIDNNGSVHRTVLVAVLAIAANIGGRLLSAPDYSDTRYSTTESAPVEAAAPTSAVDPVAEQLRRVAATVQPTKVDPITQLEGADAEGRTFIYRYKILRRDASDEAFEKFFWKNIAPKVCGNKDMARDLKDYQVTYRYSYKMPNADAPLDFDLKWQDCEAAAGAV